MIYSHCLPYWSKFLPSGSPQYWQHLLLCHAIAYGNIVLGMNGQRHTRQDKGKEKRQAKIVCFNNHTFFYYGRPRTWPVASCRDVHQKVKHIDPTSARKPPMTQWGFPHSGQWPGDKAFRAVRQRLQGEAAKLSWHCDKTCMAFPAYPHDFLPLLRILFRTFGGDLRKKTWTRQKFYSFALATFAAHRPPMP